MSLQTERLPSRTIVGRDRELGTLEAFLDEAAAAPASLVLQGEPGIGKTVLWRETVERARRSGFNVLSANPAEAEKELSFAALGDLIGSSSSAVSALPEPQRRALRVALLLEPPGDAPFDERAVAVATLGLLRLLAEAGPVLAAIDDGQWLDPPSAAVLQYVFRRLAGGRIGVLWATRESNAHPAPPDAETLSIGPLDGVALAGLIEERLGMRLQRPLVLEIRRVSGGNPLYALELARALQGRGGTAGTGEPLPVPAALANVVGERLAQISPLGRHVLLVAAALAQADEATVERALVGKLEGLEEVVEAGVLHRVRGRLRFDHPLFASVHYARTAASTRRAVHLQLAELVDDLEERAAHLAAAADAPNAETATVLESAAARARSRGATTTAADLAERAVALTPEDAGESRARRQLEAASLALASGAPARAAELLESALEDPAGLLRAEMHRLLAEVRAEIQGLDAAREQLHLAATSARGDDTLLAAINGDLAWNANASANLARAGEYARLSLQHAERSGDQQRLAGALARVAFFQFAAGGGLDLELVERAVELDPAFESSFSPTVLRGILLLWSGELDAARLVFAAYRDWARARDDVAESTALTWLGVAALRASRYREATLYFQEARNKEAEFGLASGQQFAKALEAVAEAHLGNDEAVERLAREALELPSGPQARMDAYCALGLVQIARGDVHSANEFLSRGGELARTHGIVDPGIFAFTPDEIEAAIGVGDLERADALLSDFDTRARRVDRAWALATGARCRALQLDARGDFSAALVAVTEALRHHDRVPQPFDRARTMLVHGTLLRRAKQIGGARAVLNDAVEVFDEVGARVWAERARGEIARLGGRASRSRGLTPTEQQVADLVAAGKSNQDVARALHVSAKTVEWNLSKVYKKLHISSRTELAAKARQEPPG